MKKISDMGRTLKELDGAEALDAEKKPLKIKGLIANALVGAKSPDPIRMFDLALKINKSEEMLEIEDADATEIIKAIKENQNWNNLIKAQCLQLIEDK